MKSTDSPIISAGRSGIRKAFRGFLWIMKIFIPVSFCTAVLDWSGFLEKVRFIIEPFMAWLSLPADAALPLVIGLVNGMYGAIAAMSMLSFTKAQMTLIAVFLMIAHSLIHESLIQGKAGIHPLKVASVRLTAAVLAVIAVAPFLDITSPTVAEKTVLIRDAQNIGAMILFWGKTTFSLSLKLLVIIGCVMVLLEIAKRFGWIDRVVSFFRPVLRIMGLDQSSGSMWLTGNLFGIMFGAAVIVEEARAGEVEERELERLNLSIGISHSIMEDPLLFMALGLNPVIILLPRVIMAIIVVRVYNMGIWIKNNLTQRRKWRIHRRKS